VRWNYLNLTGGFRETDASVVEICAVPAGTLAHTASVTLLGTQNILLLPGFSSSATGSCTNGSFGPITVFLSRPHMHLLAVNSRSVVHRSNQPPNVVFDEPYSFCHQPYYETNYTLERGDSIESTCVYDPTAFAAFGEEVCYHYTYSYPAGALDQFWAPANTCMDTLL
jgi:hypothetical protein